MKECHFGGETTRWNPLSNWPALLHHQTTMNIIVDIPNGHYESLFFKVTTGKNHRTPAKPWILYLNIKYIVHSISSKIHWLLYLGMLNKKRMPVPPRYFFTLRDPYLLPLASQALFRARSFWALNMFDFNEGVSINGSITFGTAETPIIAIPKEQHHGNTIFISIHTRIKQTESIFGA